MWSMYRVLKNNHGFENLPSVVLAEVYTLVVGTADDVSGSSTKIIFGMRVFQINKNSIIFEKFKIHDHRFGIQSKALGGYDICSQCQLGYY